jgi:redox-sensitive bicupin YhaK (pirin superfamily)
MTQVRPVERILRAYPTVEGAGVHLHRTFGSYEVPEFDPFLMLDDFRARRPEEYLAGFPTHPHRGIETVTYMLEGYVEHADSMGNAGTVNAGSVQWMTAGSGIVHSEMPKPLNGKMGGFQVWVNLPRSHKMMDPRYRRDNRDRSRRLAAWGCRYPCHRWFSECGSEVRRDIVADRNILM